MEPDNEKRIVTIKGMILRTYFNPRRTFPSMYNALQNQLSLIIKPLMFYLQGSIKYKSHLT